MRLRSATMAGVAACEQSSTTITSSTQGSCNTVSTTWRNVACSLYAGITTDRTGLGSRGESGENVMSICQSSFSFLKAIWIFGFQLQLIAPRLIQCRGSSNHQQERQGSAKCTWHVGQW